MDSPWAGQCALVTGAGSEAGIGFAVARKLHALGVDVTITSTTERIHIRKKEIDAARTRIHSAVADLTSEIEAKNLVDGMLSRTGRITILVNNAGMAQTGVAIPGALLHEMELSVWQAQIAITLNTAFLVTRAVLPAMKEKRYGRIVNVSSVTGPLVGNAGSSAYGAAKAGMDGMMRSAAIEIAGDGITINAVAPGWIATASSTEEELVAGRHTPVGRCGTPEEVAAAVCFLASREASYITGQALVVDGGNILQEKKGS
ncbi:MAG TPA: SDR family NAD(P)-dependent oxidoreductase [Candidatus Eremiobacteraceae bacterium]|nr:SDR family NAD(P)-dependent oxidoreductase [Candidatus Eremiobacteraceae bacterium]